jgi:hypothetical protein
LKTEDTSRYTDLIRDMRSREDSIDALQAEFESMKVETFARIVRTLFKHRDRAAELRVALHAAPHAERDRLAEQYREAHGLARTYRYYLDVQRDAMGLRRLDRKDPEYYVPPLDLPDSKR